MSIMNDYNKALQAIYDHVGFTPDWVVYPIDDRTDAPWKIIHNKSVCFYDKDGEEYQDTIYTQRFYRKHVYRGAEITMIFVDPGVDGMKYFAIFDNAKEMKDES